MSKECDVEGCITFKMNVICGGLDHILQVCITFCSGQMKDLWAMSGVVISMIMSPHGHGGKFINKRQQVDKSSHTDVWRHYYTDNHERWVLKFHYTMTVGHSWTSFIDPILAEIWINLLLGSTTLVTWQHNPFQRFIRWQLYLSMWKQCNHHIRGCFPIKITYYLLLYTQYWGRYEGICNSSVLNDYPLYYILVVFLNAAF